MSPACATHIWPEKPLADLTKFEQAWTHPTKSNTSKSFFWKKTNENKTIYLYWWSKNYVIWLVRSWNLCLYGVWIACHTDDQRIEQPYFQSGLLSEIVTITNLQHAKSRVWTCTEPEFRLSWMKLHSSDNHYNMAPGLKLETVCIKLRKNNYILIKTN